MRETMTLKLKMLWGGGPPDPRFSLGILPIFEASRLASMERRWISLTQLRTVHSMIDSPLSETRLNEQTNERFWTILLGELTDANWLMGKNHEIHHYFCARHLLSEQGRLQPEGSAICKMPTGCLVRSCPKPPLSGWLIEWYILPG